MGILQDRPNDPLYLVVIMVLMETLDQFTPLNLNRYGVVPWSIDHLIGIPLMPFLHSGFPHLISNAVPLLVLGMFLAQRGLFRQVTFWGALISGALVWLIPIQGGLHIGASGVVFVFIGFFLLRGLRTRYTPDILIGVVVAILRGRNFMTET